MFSGFFKGYFISKLWLINYVIVHYVSVLFLTELHSYRAFYQVLPDVNYDLNTVVM